MFWGKRGDASTGALAPKFLIDVDLKSKITNYINFLSSKIWTMENIIQFPKDKKNKKWINNLNLPAWSSAMLTVFIVRLLPVHCPRDQSECSVICMCRLTREHLHILHSQIHRWWKRETLCTSIVPRYLHDKPRWLELRSVWSFWVIDTSSNGNQRALISHQFQNYE